MILLIDFRSDFESIFLRIFTNHKIFIRKKIFLFLALAGTTFLTSCGSDDDNGTPTASAIVLTSDVATVELGGSFTFTVTNNLTTNVTATSAITANDVAITGNVFTPTTPGTYVISAVNGALTSADVTVTVAVPANKVVFGTQAVGVSNSILVFWGGYNADEDATVATHGLWSLLVLDSDDPNTSETYVDAEFINPLVDGELEFLDSSNAVFNQIYEATLAGTEVVITSQVNGTATIEDFPEAIDTQHAASVTTTVNGTPFFVNFDANWLGFVDNSAGKSSSYGKVINASNSNTKVITKAQLAQAKAQFFASLKK